MTATVERLGLPLRTLARQLEPNLADRRADLAWAQAPRAQGLGFSLKPADAGRRAAWWLLGQWLCGYALGELDADATLQDAEAWFYGGSVPDRLQLAPPGVGIPFEAAPAEAWALLPYLLDPAGQGTRRQVLSSDEHARDRAHRKKNGVYYTPADVADFMTRAVGAERRDTVLDPACGTAVFLRASLMLNPSVMVFGIDIDPLAVEMAAFVLLATIGEAGATPWASWHQNRLHLAAVDALTLRQTTASVLPSADRCDELDAAMSDLAVGEMIPPAELHDTSPALEDIFPQLAGGADAVVSNPPYAALGPRTDLDDLAARFSSYSTAAPSPASNIFLPFVEMGWRLADNDGGAAFVLPLSIAYRGSRQFADLRAAMMEAGGSWRFVFLDRTPDAVFGDDVKTRAAIAIRETESPTSGNMAVTGLLRWTSHSRARLWKSVQPVEAVSDIRHLIPKLNSAAEAELYRATRALPGRLGNDVTASAAVAVSPDLNKTWPDSVLVAPTAYNWLSCARDPAALVHHGHNSSSPMTALRFASAEFADAAYALLASRLTYWLWRVEGDAFHVPRGFLSSLPFQLSRLSADALATLATIGQELWQEAAAAPVFATNKGKRTVGFRASPNAAMARRAEAAVGAALGLRAELTAATLEDWYYALVVVDETDIRRRNDARRDTSMLTVTPEQKELSKLTKEEWREYTKTVWHIANTSDPDHPAVFPAEIPHRLVKLFSFHDEIVLDPFGGVGTTALAAAALGRRSISIDQNSDYVTRIRSDQAKLNGTANLLDVRHGDARSVLTELPSNSVGLAVTSPPYWNKADYGPSEANLGNTASYPGFIQSLAPVFEEVYRVLSPGRKFCVVTANVNQHTDHGLLTFPLATDLVVLLRDLGFVVINELIWSKDGTGGKWGSAGQQRPIFGSYPYPPNLLFKNVHEYIIVVAKPPAKPSKGKTVLPYNEIMEIV